MQFILIFCFPVSATGKEYIIGTAVFVSLHMNCCKTLYFRCILISRFWNAEISLHFNLAFSQCSTSIYQSFDGQNEFLTCLDFFPAASEIYFFDGESTKIRLLPGLVLSSLFCVQMLHLNF